MKAKSSKESKKDKPAVKIKDLKPTKDAKGGSFRDPNAPLPYQLQPKTY